MTKYPPLTRTIRLLGSFAILWALNAATDLHAQRPPYDVFPPADPPYYRVRYEAGAQKGELVYPVNYTIWIPKGVKSLRGVIVHQHGCGEGSCKSGLTGAYDLHWQALARKHDCALLAPSYEQPDKADCQMWCDPRNGSGAAFQKCLVDLGVKSGHPELPKVPWALWGHSGGGHWAGGMVLLYPERVAAAWLRSGVPMLKAKPGGTIKTHTLPDGALKVPVMCNLGTKEGVTVKGDRFAGVWPANEAFFNAVRGKGGLISVAVDPLSSHECGNQRYFAIPWLDACLSARLPKVSGEPFNAMPTDQAWLAPITGAEAVPAAKFAGDPLKAAWLPNETIAKAWMQYVKDTAVTDTTPPPAPTNLRLKGNELTWEAEADLESGLASFIIERDGKFLAKVPEQGKNPFGRPIFQNLQYSDTPTQPLVQMRYTDTKGEPGTKHTYRVIAVNMVGLKSMPSGAAQGGSTTPNAQEQWEKLPNGILGRLAGFDGAGGVKIAGYVRKPAGAGPFPIVIILHGGGPTARATSAATEEARTKLAADEAVRAGNILGRASNPPIPDFLAQGWAVYSIDYRTNPRYTLDPLEWEDTLIAVKKARAFDFVDPDRMAMIGGSHGGHVAARMVSRVNLACAVLCAPAGLDLLMLADLAGKGTPVGGNQKLIREMEQRTKAKMADIERDPAAYQYSSPLTEIAKVRCPILMISGRNDNNAPLPVMEAYVNNLRAAGKQAETYHPDNGPHGFYWGIPRAIPETAESTRRAVAFIKQHFAKAPPGVKDE